MDKRNLIGLLIIALIIILYPYYVQLFTGPKELPPPVEKETVLPDSSAVQQEEAKPADLSTAEAISPDSTLPEKRIIVENSLYKGVFSSNGALLKSLTLKKFEHFQDGLIEIIPTGIEYPLNVTFSDISLDLSRYNFAADRESLFLSTSHPVDTLNFVFSVEGISIIKRYIFFENRYDFQLHFEINSKDKNLGRTYFLSWGSGVRPTETNLQEDLGNFAAYSLQGTEIVKINKFEQPKGSDTGKIDEHRTGETKWVATKSKYFMASLAPLSRDAEGFKANGTRIVKLLENKSLEEKTIGVSLEMPVSGNSFQDNFLIYVGPIDYHILKNYKLGLENLVDFGWKIIKPFSLAVLWILVTLHKVIPNYGLVIIVFTILLKILFHPLTHKSVTSATKMAELQPKMAELKEKYKKDPQRMNQEIMKLYKDQGVNPFGGCLPLLVQMPVFYGLFVVFRSTIELRGANFIFWLNDLSQMDKYYILPIIMAVTMFWQQKMTIKDPKQMPMVYLMPILFFFLFKSFPAGLTLYWTFFNILSLIEQYYIKSKTKPKVAPA
ncbi:MAG: membrane protein insertase YidC [candidate division Zixibacteria bacterium]|nr:membrane protein insertase YidC [candidate division Zixibacteria bacterium]